MPNNKNDKQSGSHNSMSSESDREFGTQGKDPGSGMGAPGQSSGTQRKGSGSDTEDDDMTTAGGREGNFSDKNRGSEGQWSPGSTHSSDQ